MAANLAPPVGNHCSRAMFFNLTTRPSTGHSFIHEYVYVTPQIFRFFKYLVFIINIDVEVISKVRFKCSTKSLYLVRNL